MPSHGSLDRRRALALIGVLGLVNLLPFACRTHVPPPVAAESVDWQTYTNAATGYSLEHPAPWSVREPRPGEVDLRQQGLAIARVVYVTERDARRRALWPGHEPSGDIELGGRPGKRYVYDHRDDPFALRTVSYVVEHRGKLLALELRVPLGPEEDADPTYRRIRDSFRFTGTATGDS